MNITLRETLKLFLESRKHMLIIGSHVSYKKETGLVGSVKEALSYGANTFMFYTGAPQNTARFPINEDQVAEAFALMEEHNMIASKVIVHAPYIINLANGDEEKFDFSCRFLQQELQRVAACRMHYLVLHPGSHVGQGVDVGIDNVIRGLNRILEQDDSDVMILLETMAGKGTELGRDFHEIKRIIEGVKKQDRIGVCLDTCHIHDAGYSLNEFDKVLDDFDQLIGLDKLKCLHINDSKNYQGAHKDRHANIGFGEIGFDTLLNIIYHKKLEEIPKILETPYVDRMYPPYRKEIAMIKSKQFDPELLEKIKIHPSDES